MGVFDVTSEKTSNELISKRSLLNNVIDMDYIFFDFMYIVNIPEILDTWYLRFCGHVHFATPFIATTGPGSFGRFPRSKFL